MHTQYQHEPQVIIDNYHRDAIQAEQLRLARGTQPGRLATMMVSLRAALGSVQAQFHREPVEAAEPAAAQELVVTPVESAVAA